MKRPLISALIATSVAISMTGCKTLDPYTGEEKTSNTTKGGAIGAVVGAVVGYVSSKDKSRRDRKKAILAGAAIGGAGGAAVGNFMDRQEEKLRKQLEGSGVSVTRAEDDSIILNMPGNITFETAKFDVKGSFHEVLNSVVLVLNEFDQTIIEAAGHTDSVGSESSNLTLSRNRANGVGDYLISQGVSSDRVMTVGHGELRPIADNNTAEGREQNRRVELTLIPITE